MTLKTFRLTARVDWSDKPLTSFVVQAFDADEAHGYRRLPMPYKGKGPVTWDVEEVTIRNDPPPTNEDAARLLTEAVKLLERLRHSDESNWRERFEETDAFLAKVRP